jgi:hypothetical protein
VTIGVPVEPDAPDARELLLNELSDPAYAESQPTFFDLLSQAVFDWFGSLRLGVGEGPPAVALVIGAVVLAAAIVAAILIYGLPRWRTRSRREAGELLGENDRRTARQLRRDAERAAAAGDWSLAIAERYRAIARALDERTIVTALPGTTAHGFARSAARQFPDHGTQLEAAADRFDGVRYLGRAGTADDYDLVRTLDDTLDAARSPLPDLADLAVAAPR